MGSLGKRQHELHGGIPRTVHNISIPRLSCQSSCNVNQGVDWPALVLLVSLPLVPPSPRTRLRVSCHVVSG